MLEPERLIWCFIFVRLGILRSFFDKHWQQCVSQPSENWRIHPSIEWPFIVPLSRNVIPILGVSQYQWEAYQLPSMNPPRSWSTLSSVSLHKGLQFCLLFFSSFEIDMLCILLRYREKWFPIRKFQLWPRPDRLRLCHLDDPVCRILLSIFVFSPHNMHQTLHCGIQCLGAVLFLHSIILWISRHTWKQPHRLETPVIEWMLTRLCSDLKFESNSHIHRNSSAHTIFHLVPMRLIKYSKTP